MNEKFTYTYTAPTENERKEIERIRNKYAPKDQTTVEKLKTLDKTVHLRPTVWGLTLGTIGTLIFGTGLAFILEWQMLLWGCIISAVGVIPVALAYPVYKRLLDKNKNKYADEILALSEQLLQN